MKHRADREHPDIPTASFRKHHESRAKPAKANERKELLLLEGCTYFDLYDRPEYVAPAIAKMDESSRSTCSPPVGERPYAEAAKAHMQGETAAPPASSVLTVRP